MQRSPDLVHPNMFRTSTAALALVFFTLIAGQTAATAAATDTAPAATVDALHASLDQSMAQAAKLGCEGRLQLMGPAVDQAFDLPFIAERTLRRHWKSLDADQRARFNAALRRSFVTTYATEFARPDAVRFATLGTDQADDASAVVRTSLKPQTANAVSLDYVMKRRDERWQVVNVLAEGVSDLALRATQYDGLMKREGFAALIDRLDTQTQAIKARCK